MDAPASYSHSGRANKRKRESSDLDEKPVGTPESSKQATNFSKRMPHREEKVRLHRVRVWPTLTKAQKILTGGACSLTSDLAEILQEKPSLASSAVDLLDLYLCLWECYIIKSAGKIRLEEERRFLQNSNEWLVKENEKLQQCCNNQELLLWDRRQAFLSVHQGVLFGLGLCKWIWMTRKISARFSGYV